MGDRSRAKRAALPALTVNLKEVDPFGETPCKPWKKSGSDAKLIVPTLRKLLLDKSTVVRQNTLDALSTFGPTVIPIFTELLPRRRSPGLSAMIAPAV